MNSCIFLITNVNKDQSDQICSSYKVIVSH